MIPRVCVNHRQLANTIKLVRQCPDVRFILDHIAKPDIKAGLLDPKLAAQKYARYAQYDGVTDAVAVDDVTVKVTLNKPNGSLMSALSDPRANMIPQEFEQFPPQPRNLSLIIPCHKRFGGVSLRYPMAITYMDGTEP